MCVGETETLLRNRGETFSKMTNWVSEYTWSPMNRFRTDQGPCRVNLHKWDLTQSPSCDCGQRQTMNHIVDKCPLTQFVGGLNLLHEADDDAVVWLESTATAALAK